MTILRAALKAKAQDQLQEMIMNLEAEAQTIVKGSTVKVEELCKLIANPNRSATLVNQLTTRIAQHYEAEMLMNLENER